MKHKSRYTSNMLAVVTTLALAGVASARQDNWTAIQPEINACVEAVGQHANYSDATRVRHAVVGVKERTVGYKLTIETAIYTDNGDVPSREYATSCIVNGNHAPMQFAIIATNDGA
ncbi:MAG: hypothetical protein OEW64_00105 [Gammaproteobacteria bacterium]|nr:hypothetical protein [Gammaproteobacteria bacterium]MDH5302479.1 hypothetical protein [Gammaproteobacteria bacterium]MDH5321361.1 hypothetical protein [Gammaproteobacteria bacterium]